MEIYTYGIFIEVKATRTYVQEGVEDVKKLVELAVSTR